MMAAIRRRKVLAHRGLAWRLICSFLTLLAVSTGLWLNHDWNATRYEASSRNDPSRSSVLSSSMRYKPPTRKLTLRFDWTSLQPTSTFAKAIFAHQNNCSLPLADFRFRNRFGMGSDLHVWTQAICNALDEGYRMRTEMPWIYHAEKSCRDSPNASAMACYFPKSELQCPGDFDALYSPLQTSESRHKLYRARGKVARACDRVLETYNLTYSDVRAAGVEFLFSQASKQVQDEAERQLHQVFARRPAIPDNLITVHIRWGDKKDEMTLVPIEDYIKAVQLILERRQNRERPNDDDKSAHIFLATEDPEAVVAFTQAAPPGWNLYMDQFFHDLLPHRDAEYNGNPRMAQRLLGEPGLKALGSLLVAMEANDFVLTTQSNWSRLMNELRKTILESRCQACTSMIDLSEGEW